MQPSNRPGLIDDCFLTDSDRLSHDAALALLRSRLGIVAKSVRVALQDATGRICAEPVRAPRDIPGYDNSAVDGYAFGSADHGVSGGRFEVAMRIAAGDPFPEALPKGAAARIFTGAPMPPNADTVAMQEDCVVDPSGAKILVTIPAGLKPGANRRRAGEDVKAGGEIVAAGRTLRPQDIAAIASTGLPEIGVFSKLKVGLVSSGNELRRPGDLLRLGEVYDSNHFLLRALLYPLGVEVSDLGVLPDDRDITLARIGDAAGRHDVLLTTGGASRGEEDHLAAALSTLGKRHLWQIAVKPGRPMSFGQIGNTAVFGLPGNPVAAFVCFLLYVRPAIFRLGGGNWIEPRRYGVAAGFSFPKKKTGRREFWRGTLKTGPDGITTVHKFERDGSGLITGLREADGLIEIGEEVSGVAKGDIVAFVPFSEFGIG